MGFEVKKDTELTEEQLLAAGEVVIGRMDIIADTFKRLDAGETKDAGPLYDIKAQIAYWSVASAVREIRANRAA